MNKTFHIQRITYDEKIWLSILAVAVLAGGIYLVVSAINPVAPLPHYPQVADAARPRWQFDRGFGGVSDETWLLRWVSAWTNYKQPTRQPSTRRSSRQ